MVQDRDVRPGKPVFPVVSRVAPARLARKRRFLAGALSSLVGAGGLTLAALGDCAVCHTPEGGAGRRTLAGDALRRDRHGQSDAGRRGGHWPLALRGRCKKFTMRGEVVEATSLY